MYYSPYDKFQCDITWTPTIFTVLVNATDHTITPTVKGPGNGSMFDDGTFLMQNSMSSLGLLAQTASSVAYSSVGESLVTNWQTQFNRTFAQNETLNGDPTQIAAAEDSFNAMLDDIMGGFNAAQLWFSPQNASQGNTSSLVPANLTYSAVRIGDKGYIWATLGINLVILIIAIEEIIRTKNWRRLALFDYLDLKSVIIAASAGGPAVVDAVRTSYQVGSHWTGDAGSREAAMTRVRLAGGDDEKGDEPAIVLISKEKKSEDEEKTPLV